MEQKATIQVIGDFGNPKGNGLSGIEVHGLPDHERATQVANLGIFHAALVTAGLTGTAVGDKVVTIREPLFADKPAADVNVDSVIVCQWRQKNVSKIREITICGIDESSAALEDKDQGKRLNAAGKLALASALNSLYDLTVVEEQAVVLEGVYYVKK